MIRGFVFVFSCLLHYMFGIGMGESLKGDFLYPRQRSSVLYIQIGGG